MDGEIIFTDGHFRHAKGGVAFLASHDGRPVECVVTDEALVSYFGAGSPAGSEAVFASGRGVIQKIAEDLIRRGRVSPEGELLITASDVRSSGH